MSQKQKQRYAEVVISLATRALDAPFTYEVPESFGQLSVGDAVIVELGSQTVIGYVVGVGECAVGVMPSSPARADGNFQSNFDPSELKPILAVLHGPFFGAQGYELARWIARYYAAPLSEAMRLLLPTGLTARLKKALSAYQETEEAVMPARRPRKASSLVMADLKDAHLKPAQLTDGQTTALDAVLNDADQRPFVIAGVTGSGKTEVYLQAIEAVRAVGRTAILLVPEISLTPQTVGRIRSRFGDDVAVLHSGLSDGERYTQWEKARTGEAGVVVGARSALFAPLSNLGLVIIDEEHDSSYKQSNAPRYHAREVAERLCELAGARLVLGSATPSMEVLHKAETDSYRLVHLPARVNAQPLPQVRLVDLGKEFAAGNRSMFSRELEAALEEVRKHREKAILLLNRRGFAQFLLCRECGHVPGCEHCSTSLTYHEPQHHLRCHQCNVIKPVPSVCPACESPYLKQFGGGVQKVEQEFRQRFGDWPLIRMDADTTATQGAHGQLLEQFAQLETGVLLGTQMVAKGHDFPDVTLVGVINADVTLNLPDFRAAERGYQLLEQVAGRAGRAGLPGKVIIQTYTPDNPACRAVEAHDREVLFEGERVLRKAFAYPPYASLANIVISSIDEGRVQKYAERLKQSLRENSELKKMGAVLLGPAPCVLSRKARSYRYHIMLKAPEGAELGPAILDALQRTHKTSEVKVSVDVNPTDTF